uniref:Mesoderm development candidate 2 n=1 Tax=Plectus sambesii TaxID=2011161 RepID=A0A914XEB9_9BILA
MARWLALVLMSLIVIVTVLASTKSDKPKKKDIRDYSDADLERLYEEWEENDEDELPEDEKPEHKRPKPAIDLSKLDANSNPEDVMKMSKKGQAVMMFVGVSGNPTKAETEKLSALWQTSLYNNHIEAQK